MLLDIHCEKGIVPCSLSIAIVHRVHAQHFLHQTYNTVVDDPNRANRLVTVAAPTIGTAHAASASCLCG